MTLIVEDGTPLSNSESYVSEATFKTYADNHGFDYSAYSDLQIEQAARRATQFIDSYRFRFPGYRTLARLQALEWPRIGAYTDLPSYGRGQILIEQFYYDPGFNYIAPNVIPIEIINAQCEAMGRELAIPGYLLPDFNGIGTIKMQSAGDTKQEFFASQTLAFGPRVQIITAIMAALFIDGTNSSLYGRTHRIR